MRVHLTCSWVGVCGGERESLVTEVRAVALLSVLVLAEVVLLPITITLLLW